MPPTFEQLRPLFVHMLNTGAVKAFLTNLDPNAECSIPALPTAACSAVSLRICSLPMLAQCHDLQANAALRIQHVTLTTANYTFRIDYRRRRAVLRTHSDTYTPTYLDLLAPLPGIPLMVVYTTQN